MKRLFILIFAVMLAAVSVTSCGLASAALSNLDANALASAANNAMTALTISDDQIAALSSQSVAYMDSANVVESGAYTTRLKKVMAGINSVNGLPLNIKVYKTNEVNAFACGDGSIRVYTGLMDVMSDDELIAIIGHEIGHVVHKDTKNAMKKAYMAYAARDVVSATGGVVGALSQSVLGDLASSYVNAQFSQKQEYAADEYGFQFAIDHGHSKYSMYNALAKLLTLSKSSGTASRVAQMFSSHPGTEDRAAKMKAMAEAYGK